MISFHSVDQYNQETMGEKRKARAIGARVHRYVNQRRENDGLSALQGSSKLVSYAEFHSQTMAKTDHRFRPSDHTFCREPVR